MSCSKPAPCGEAVGSSALMLLCSCNNLTCLAAVEETLHIKMGKGINGAGTEIPSSLRDP